MAEKMEELKTKFDIILVETAALSEMDKAKEWLQFTGRAVAVYEKGRTITEAKKPGVAYLESMGNTFAGWVLNKTS